MLSQLSESATSSIASSPPTFEEIPRQETDHSSHGQTRTFADITKKLPTSTIPMKTKSTNAWPSVKSRRHAGATLFNKDEEEISKVETKTDDKSNAWPVKPNISTYSGTTGTSSSNEDEKRPYASERKLLCYDYSKLVKNFSNLLHLNHCFQKRKMKVAQLVKRRRRRRIKELYC